MLTMAAPNSQSDSGLTMTPQTPHECWRFAIRPADYYLAGPPSEGRLAGARSEGGRPVFDGACRDSPCQCALDPAGDFFLNHLDSFSRRQTGAA